MVDVDCSDFYSAISRRLGDGSQCRPVDSKEVKTVYDLINHLTGRPVPAIPINCPLTSNALERVKLLYWQLDTLLTFLR